MTTREPATIPPHWGIASHKGGVGKTLVVTLLAAAAADAGMKVLVVDMDAQANATRRLATPLPDDPDARSRASLAAVLQRPRPGDAARIITPCGWPDPYPGLVHVAPGHLDLELLPATAAQPGSSRRLLTALTGVADDYDLVLIDCPPSLQSHIVDMAWTATDHLWIPCEPEHDSIEAARRIIERVDRDRDILNPDLAVAGLVCNRYRQQLGLHQQRRTEMGSVLGPEAVAPWVVPELALLKTLGETNPARPLSAAPGHGPWLQMPRDLLTWMTGRAQALAGAES